MFGEAHESDDSLSQALPQGSMLVVHNPWGAVSVTGSSDDGQVHVSVHKQVYAWRDSDADERAQRLQPTFSTQGNNLMLDVPPVNQGQADLTIEMPHGAGLSLSADHGDVHVSELRGDVTVSARKGDVDLSGIDGQVLAQVNNDDSSVTAKSVTGAFTLQGRAGDISLTNINGPVMLQGDFFGTTHAEQVNGPLRFETSRTKFATARVDGELSIESGDLQGNKLLGPVTLTTRNRTIELDDVSGPVTLSNRNGTVSVTNAAPGGADQHSEPAWVGGSRTAGARRVCAGCEDQKRRPGERLRAGVAGRGRCTLAERQGGRGRTAGSGGDKRWRCDDSQGRCDARALRRCQPTPKVSNVPPVPGTPGVPAVPKAPEAPKRHAKPAAKTDETRAVPAALHAGDAVSAAAIDGPRSSSVAFGATDIPGSSARRHWSDERACHAIQEQGLLSVAAGMSVAYRWSRQAPRNRQRFITPSSPRR